MKLLIRGGRVIDPANEIDAIMDVLVADGKIEAIAPNIQAEGAINIDAAGKWVCPGFIDMHVHLREPGFEYKEDIASGTRAAAAGGFTTVCCMPNTDPVIDNAAVASFVRERAQKSGVVNVLPIGSITKKQAGRELSEMAELVEAGCVAVSDDGLPVADSAIMRNALQYADMFGLPVLSHCEDLNLARDGQMHEGYYSIIYGLKGIPAAAEEIMVARDIILAQTTGAQVHICHVSTAGSIDMIRDAQERGVQVSCEVTPHHLILTDEIVGSYDADTKVNPPLRPLEDVVALREGLLDGTIDCIATDHAPHHLESKDCEYNLAAFGISGLETAVALIMDKLVHPQILDAETMVSLFTIGPADILGINKGSLDVGTDADITIVDPELVREVNPREFYSKGKNTPFKGMVLKGWPWMTIVSGRVVYKEGKIITE
ncbi:Dihydroorotase [Syntrophomonas zehnderi OL-4]|uniref:Dihydroorotase n=1 Tax=Syntrophomonas zehnderi OL-4 TaxID=690567 RepID=A0A0E3W3D9_9FIRM|nr:dihydroorotase [Syntrophomonas zehnderi]CFX75145.1 Dihydroorotase [Syntrophomonas zehnderi OL-4]